MTSQILPSIRKYGYYKLFDTRVKQRVIIDGKKYLGFNIHDKKLEKPKMYLQHRFTYEVFKGVIPSCLEIDHINNCKTDNRIKNLQLLNHYQNTGKSRNKSIISTTIENGEKKVFISIRKAEIELGISSSSIVKICKQRKHFKSATSKNDGKKYTFEYLI